MGNCKFLGMLPKDIINIINNYNEIGIFVICFNKIYWFNGKRFEYWCPWQDAICTYENDLYYRLNHKVFQYNKNNEIKVPQIWNHPLHLLAKKDECIAQVICQGQVYTHHHCGGFDRYDGKIITILPTKIYSGRGLYLIVNGNYIYSFGSMNERFDIITETWTALTCTVKFLDGIVYSMNDKIYQISDDLSYKIYNIELNLWQ